MIGWLIGAASALFFSASSILVRIGQRRKHADDGVLMTVFVNLVVLSVVGLFVTRPSFDLGGVVALVSGGILGTVFGRSFQLRSVRLIGPSRASAFITGTPLVAAIGGWIVLGEELAPLEAAGGALVVAGLLWLVRVRAGAGGSAEKVPLSSYLVAAGAPVFFGSAFVVRKLGLRYFDSAVLGALIGVAAAFAVLLLIDVVRRQLGQRISKNLRPVPWFFVAAGFTTAMAILSQFYAFGYLPAWVVGILQGTQGIWTVFLGYVFLKGDEKIDSPLLVSVGLVVSGVILIALQ